MFECSNEHSNPAKFVWALIYSFHVQSSLTNNVCVTTNGWVEVYGMCEILQTLIWFIGCFSVWSIHDNLIDDIDEYKSFMVGGVAIGCSLAFSLYKII